MTDQTRQYILDLFSIVSTDSILIITPAGLLKRLNCPFYVVCKVDVSLLRKGQEYTVNAVKMTLKLEDVFIIKGKAYLIWCFAIVG
ncbi:MAG: hypothetical protein WCI31_07945 [Prolixibacteraceae bacterium]